MIDAHFHYHMSDGGGQREIEKIYHILDDEKIDKIVWYDLGDENTSPNIIFEKKRYNLNYGNRIIPAYVIDFRNSQAINYLDIMQQHGIRIVKLLPYEQNIRRDEYERVVAFAKEIEKRNMILTICAAYGSDILFDTNGVELAATILQNGLNGPLILAHGGMPKVIDTLSLMEVYDNLFFDFSFALNYFWESSIITDYAFVMKKLKYKRMFFGTDYPYIQYQDAKKIFNEFCSIYGITSADRKRLEEDNFLEFCSQYQL